MIETLEPRRMLSAYGKYDAKGVFRVFGTEGDDRFEVTFEPQYGVDYSSTDNRSVVGHSPTVKVNGQPLRILGKLRVDYPRPVRFYLGSGDDSLTITNPTADVKGYTRFIVDAGDGNDSISTGIGDDVITAGAGNDTVSSLAGNDSIDGGSGSDDLRPGLGDNTVLAGSGNDRVRHGGGNDRITGGKGDDRFFTSSSGSTSITGDAGNDTLYSGSSRDEFSGGAGVDVADYSARTEDLKLELRLSSTPRDADRLVPGLGENQPHYRNHYLWDDGRATLNETEILYGESGPTQGKLIKNYLVPDEQAALHGTGRLEGDRLVDVEAVLAGSGDDVFVGSEGRDILYGGAGNDTFFAGGGQDDLYGQDGDDSFFTVDTRDGMPTAVDETSRLSVTDLVDGGAGTDFVRYDVRDFAEFRFNVEKLEALRALYS